MVKLWFFDHIYVLQIISKQEIVRCFEQASKIMNGDEDSRE